MGIGADCLPRRTILSLSAYACAGVCTYPPSPSSPSAPALHRDLYDAATTIDGDRDHVDTAFLRCFGVLSQVHLGGVHHAAALGGGERGESGAEVALMAGTHLDEHAHAALLGDDIDLPTTKMHV